MFVIHSLYEYLYFLNKAELNGHINNYKRIENIGSLKALYKIVLSNLHYH